MLGMPVPQAFNLLRNSGFDLATAISMQLDPHLYVPDAPLLDTTRNNNPRATNRGEGADIEVVGSRFISGPSEERRKMEYRKTYIIKKKEKPRKKRNVGKNAKGKLMNEPVEEEEFKF